MSDKYPDPTAETAQIDSAVSAEVAAPVPSAGMAKPGPEDGRDCKEDWDDWDQPRKRSCNQPVSQGRQVLGADDAEGLAPPMAGAAPVKPGQWLARGVGRHLRAHDFVSVEEFVPARGLRVDVMALGPRDEIWVIECKSCRADFQADRKWQGYLEWCDRYFWAVDADFPTDLLPEGTGLIIADAYDAEVVRMGEETKLPAARRKILMRKFARHAALRLQGLRDPGLSSVWRP